LVKLIREAPIEPGMPVAPILIVCPPPIQSPQGPLAAKFQGAEQRSTGLAEAYREVASHLGCHFFDAGSVTSSSRVDGMHLDRDRVTGIRAKGKVAMPFPDRYNSENQIGVFNFADPEQEAFSFRRDVIRRLVYRPLRARY
jgi:hypothetical protein